MKGGGKQDVQAFQRFAQLRVKGVVFRPGPKDFVFHTVKVEAVPSGQGENPVLAQLFPQGAEGLDAPGVHLKGIALGLGKEVGKQGVFQQDGTSIAVQRGTGQIYPAEIVFPQVQQLLKAGQVIPVVVGQ